MASAKFANSKVAQSHSAIASTKPGRPSPGRCPPSCAIHRPVIRRLPTSTTNITGLRHCTQGASLRKESRMAARISGGSNSGRARAAVTMDASLSVQMLELQLLDHGAEGECREEGQGADDEDDGGEQTDEQRRVGGQ